MGGAVGPVLLMAVGALPGVVALVATVLLWRRRRVLEDDVVRGWVRLGYGWLAVFAVSAIFLTLNVDADPEMVALGWIGTPALASILGLWVFAERQRLTLEEFPSPRRMRTLSIDNRQELRYVTAELSNDLNRGVGSQTAVQRGGAIGRHGTREADELERSLQRLRQAIQRCHDLDARYGLHLRRLKEVVEDPSFAEFPLSLSQEAQIEELQQAQHELDRALDKLIDHAVDCRTSINRILQSITWI
ncbi:MAG: hypothetical protein HUU35_01295 [Armatimonadetes bacterium]|nr:hypothetical protein [Armatimonadota bacterium]